MLKILPVALFAAAVVVALAFNFADDPALERPLASAFVALLGLALAAWGAQEVSRGRAWAWRRHVRRAEHPAVFWTLVVVFRFLLGLALVGVGAWYLLGGGPR